MPPHHESSDGYVLAYFRENLFATVTTETAATETATTTAATLSTTFSASMSAASSTILAITALNHWMIIPATNGASHP